MSVPDSVHPAYLSSRLERDSHEESVAIAEAAKELWGDLPQPDKVSIFELDGRYLHAAFVQVHLREDLFCSPFWLKLWSFDPYNRPELPAHFLVIDWARNWSDIDSLTAGDYDLGQ